MRACHLLLLLLHKSLVLRPGLLLLHLPHNMISTHVITIILLIIIRSSSGSDHLSTIFIVPLDTSLVVVLEEVSIGLRILLLLLP